MREAVLERKTKETQISIELNLDSNNGYDIDTGIGFLNHMLELFAFHSGISLKYNRHRSFRRRSCWKSTCSARKPYLRRRRRLW